MQVQTEEVIIYMRARVCVCLQNLYFIHSFSKCVYKMKAKYSSISIRDTQKKTIDHFDTYNVFINHVYGHFDTLAQTQTKRREEESSARKSETDTSLSN